MTKPAHRLTSSASRSVAALLLTLLCAAHASAQPQPMALDLPDINSTAFIRIADYAGKPLVINFWASDCPPCVVEMPTLFQLASKNPQIQYLGVAVDDRLKARRLLSRQTITYPQLLAPQNADGIMRRFGNPKGILPYTVVLDKSHRLCQSHQGAIDSGWLLRAMHLCAV